MIGAAWDDVAVLAQVSDLHGLTVAGDDDGPVRGPGFTVDEDPGVWVGDEPVLRPGVGPFRRRPFDVLIDELATAQAETAGRAA